MSNLSITKHNELIESSYRLTLTEARIVFYGLSLVNPTAKDFNYEFKIEIKDFAAMFNLENSKDLYGHLKSTAMDRFWLREFTFPTNNGRKLRVGWLSGIEYGDKEGYLKIFINPQLKPFLHQIHNNFTSYHLKNIARFKSVYSVRFYEFSIMNLNKSHKTKACFKITIESIREMLDLKDKYSRFSSLKARVIEASKKEINKHSDIRLNYEIVKKGRKPYEIIFTVTRKEGQNNNVLKIKEQKNDFLNSPSSMKSKKLTPAIFDKAKNVVAKAGNQWDLYAIEQQFFEYIELKGPPESLEKAFLGFVRKKVESPP